MKNIFSILCILVFSFQVNHITAQGCVDDDPSSKDSLNANKPKVFGYIQPQYDYTFNDANDNTFRFKRARIGVRGKIKGNFSYYFMLEASPFIGSSGDAYLMDAFVTYQHSNWVKASVGSFKQPFGLEVTTPCNSLTTIDRAIVSDQLVAPQRDFGLMLLGGNKYTKFNYAAALMNGRGLGVKDNNAKKDIIGRATYKIVNFLTIGGSFRYGYPSNDNDSRTTYGGDAVLAFNKLKIQVEYIYDEGDYNRASGGGCGSTPVELGKKRDGAYAMISYDINEKIQPVFKYEYFDPNIDVKKIGYQEMMTVGFNYFFNKKVRLQLNYQAHIETHLNIDNDILLAQVQFKF